MNDTKQPIKRVDPPVTPEVAEEIQRRLEPEVYEAQRKARRPALPVIERIASKHRPR